MSPTPIEGRIQSFVEDYISKWPEVFLVEVLIRVASNKATVLLDADDGINIDRCAEVNRKLYDFMEKEQLFGNENFSIEVSSPGIDRPLKLLRQYKKNIGRKVEVTDIDSKVMTGELKEADDDHIVIDAEIKENKKKIKKILTTIPFTEIRQVKVLVTF